MMIVGAKVVRVSEAISGVTVSSAPTTTSGAKVLSASVAVAGVRMRLITDATLKTSSNPARVGFALLRVNDALAVVPVALNA